MPRSLCIGLALMSVLTTSSTVLGQNEVREAIDGAVQKAVDAVEENYAKFVDANEAPIETARQSLNALVGKLNDDKKFADATKVQNALVDLEKTVMQKAVPVTFGSKPKSPPVPVPPPPNAPANLVAFRNKVGQTLEFRVTANTQGPVWGGANNVYTDDSSLAKAVVHAGVIPAGQVGVVTVKIMPGQDAYIGSNRNGITSSNWGKYGGSYRILSGKLESQPSPKPLKDRLEGEWTNPTRSEKRVFGKDGRFSQIPIKGGIEVAPLPIVFEKEKASWRYPDGLRADAWMVSDDLLAFLFILPDGRHVGDGEVWFRTK